MNLLKFLPYLYIAALIAAGWYLIDKFTPVLAPYVPATVSPQIERVPTITIEPKKVRVYAPQAKKKLGLTITAQQDNSVHVISATQVKPSHRPQTVVTTINADTGETETLVMAEPLPWFKVERGGAVGVGYDVLSGLSEAYVRQDIFRVKALVLTSDAHLTQAFATSAYVRVEYRW